jgi:hypothetical protein
MCVSTDVYPNITNEDDIKKYFKEHQLEFNNLLAFKDPKEIDSPSELASSINENGIVNSQSSLLSPAYHTSSSSLSTTSIDSNSVSSKSSFDLKPNDRIEDSNDNKSESLALVLYKDPLSFNEKYIETPVPTKNLLPPSYWNTLIPVRLWNAGYAMYQGVQDIYGYFYSTDDVDDSDDAMLINQSEHVDDITGKSESISMTDEEDDDSIQSTDDHAYSHSQSLFSTISIPKEEINQTHPDEETNDDGNEIDAQYANPRGGPTYTDIPPLLGTPTDIDINKSENNNVDGFQSKGATTLLNKSNTSLRSYASPSITDNHLESDDFLIQTNMPANYYFYVIAPPLLAVMTSLIIGQLCFNNPYTGMFIGLNIGLLVSVIYILTLICSRSKSNQTTDQKMPPSNKNTYGYRYFCAILPFIGGFSGLLVGELSQASSLNSVLVGLSASFFLLTIYLTYVINKVEDTSTSSNERESNCERNVSMQSSVSLQRE